MIALKRSNPCYSFDTLDLSHALEQRENAEMRRARPLAFVRSFGQSSVGANMAERENRRRSSKRDHLCQLIRRRRPLDALPDASRCFSTLRMVLGMLVAINELREQSADSTRRTRGGKKKTQRVSTQMTVRHTDCGSCESIIIHDRSSINSANFQSSFVTEIPFRDKQRIYVNTRAV